MVIKPPVRGDRFEDLLFGEGLGTIKGVTYVNDEPFYNVEFDNPKPGPDGRIIYDNQIQACFFNGPDDNCGTCSWDSERNLFVINPEPDALPDDHPAVIAIKAGFDRINENARQGRMRQIGEEEDHYGQFIGDSHRG